MDTFQLLAAGRCGDPFSFLGIHPDGEDGWIVRAFLPGAAAVELRSGRRRVVMEPAGETGGWTGRLPRPARTTRARESPPSYWLAIPDDDAGEIVIDDPYRFPPTLDEDRVHAFLAGTERRAHQVFGAHAHTEGRARGTRFAVWAPHAAAVNLMGDMNDWDGRRHPMRPRGATGVWELFVPDVHHGARYKYQVVTTGGERLEKADPFGRLAEVRPGNASVVPDRIRYRWNDRRWRDRRAAAQAGDAPMSVYEVHAGSWRRHEDGSWLSYRELAETLLPYVKELGFTHVELLPLTEHPLDQSWGYQPVGFFAPTSRFGSPADLRHFIDTAHQMEIGVILDWVPGHFPRDAHGLARFDGTPLYEHPDPRQAHHPDWGTLVFDYAKGPVRSFLVSSALYWLEDFHVDGLRVDAVASMLYLDYSRGEGEWVPNREGGNTNLEAVEFLKRMNDAVHEAVPGAITVAEESTAWPGVSHPTDQGGLGFDQKWNMGWMNDTLEVLADDPVYRKYRHDKLTFSIVYAFNERFVLPLSHDEVVHGKGSLIGRMPGSDEERFANLRLLLAWQWMHPGKKLLFMGGELAQWSEWSEAGSVDWALEASERHTGVRRLVADLNRLHRARPALHALDFSADGFEWLNAEDREHSTLTFLRWAPGWTDPVVVAANFTPVCRESYRIPVPREGRYRLVLNTDAPVYGGWGTLVEEVVESSPGPILGREHSVEVRLPGLAVLALVPDGA